VRWLWIVALSLAADRAAARPAAPSVQPDDAGDFWREVIEPHGVEVAAIVTRAKKALDKAAEATPDGDAAVDQHVRTLGEAYGMLRYARKLSPENTEVLGLLGTAADELAKTRQALDALEACVRIQGPERAAAAHPPTRPCPRVAPGKKTFSLCPSVSCRRRSGPQKHSKALVCTGHESRTANGRPASRRPVRRRAAFSRRRAFLHRARRYPGTMRRLEKDHVELILASFHLFQA